MMASNVSSNHSTYDLFSDDDLILLHKTINLVLCNIVAAVGMVTNILNLVVFTEQGYQDSVNISMATIAFWDLIKCLCGLIARVYAPLSLISAALSETTENITTTKVHFIQNICGYVTYPLAAYVAVERCLCVSLPFRVKAIFTRQLTAGMMVFISGSTFVSLFPLLLLYDVSWQFSPRYNQTIAHYVRSEFFLTRGKLFVDFYNVVGIMNPIVSLTITVVCTCIMAYHLGQTSRFRSNFQSDLKSSLSTASGGPRQDGRRMNAKETQVIKMLSVVNLVFIIDLVPRIIHHLAKVVETEYYIRRRYHHVFNVGISIVFFFDFFNSSANFFIFVSMSSNFKATFLERICQKKRKYQC